MPTDTMKQKRLNKCRGFSKCLAGDTHRVFLCSSVAPFSIEQEFNKQNDGILSQNVVTSNSHGKIIQKFCHLKSLMVWQTIMDYSKTPFILVKFVMKINQHLCLRNTFLDEIGYLRKILCFRMFRVQLVFRIHHPNARRRHLDGLGGGGGG